MQSLKANSSTAQIPPRDQSKPAVMWILCRNFDKTNVAVKAATARGNLFELSGLSQETCTEYMAMHLNVPLNIFPLKLVSFVAKLSLGNPMYLRETFHNLIREGHVTIELDADTKEACKVVCCEDLEGINIVGWAHTAMVGETVCLLESLDPLESATLKMTTVFSKSFTLPDLAASICSRWAGSTRFDTLRLFRAVQNLTLRGIIIPQAQPRKHLDVQPDSKDTKVTDSTRELQRYEMNNVLIRKVGGAMLLEAQKKVVKRQALIDRALARDLPARMEEVQLKKLEPHIPWYYENILTRG
ncbi:unnamed protein product [Polarella glacialis]|uniref:Uncharacterized protein n=1 Tax=Polarella glacialis TaxID=89957 RepID=A0A813F754_POLGL|nr:unnamed protein product [Polarella glacialis]